MQDSKPQDAQKSATLTDNLEAAINGQVPLRVGDVLQRSWDITLRALPMMLLGLVVLMIVNVIVSTLGQALFPVDEMELQNHMGNFAAQNILGIIVLAPFTAVLTVMALQNARDGKAKLNAFGRAFQCAPQIIAISVISTTVVVIAAVILGLLFDIGGTFVALLVLVAIYIQFSFLLAAPLVLERSMKVSRAITASFLMTNSRMLPILGIYLILSVIVFISALPLLLGLLFTIPMSFNVIGVIYNRLVGVEQLEPQADSATEQLESESSTE
ncbi:hypothetical protein CWI80_00915 [Pseudidiomarina sediminum]|uniref:Stress protein n=1 Tax=Pseudidiomarina sediminum TaxID=431675 RepID=A0A432Z7U8_9GAMM|nr:hypothetical protein [Pseudidiomarina sediminum]MBY6063103.1 hypothetical protein [Pseudidiomarina sediminum]RUO73956.1 hypothetical protein CWI80_00915 [Pseudidiomarina sediminum]